MARISDTSSSHDKRRMSVMPKVSEQTQLRDCDLSLIAEEPIDTTAEINSTNINAYNDHRYIDEELCETFCEDFGQWNEEHWNACSKHIRRSLQDMLRRNGVYVPKQNHNSAIVLKSQAGSTTFVPDWPREEILHQLNHGKIDTRNQLILEDQEYCRKLWAQGEAVYWIGTREQVQRNENIVLEELVKEINKENANNEYEEEDNVTGCAGTMVCLFV
ncbi:hypothetical protein OnM2_104037 [Erysiphe neolycopersici]|uniref:Uncharacterized protein n=1 Tax=Erysiphe neolycopersici TaxID=212602 RepID=A0A420H839_9PEZI|nr:hypothetical protein OnM2_104037 [Erysiphe neolycopersici]